MLRYSTRFVGVSTNHRHIKVKLNYPHIKLKKNPPGMIDKLKHRRNCYINAHVSSTNVWLIFVGIEQLNGIEMF